MIITTRDPCGVYKVGSSIFANKAEAVYRSSVERLPVTWDFHEDVYSKFDWTKRPAGTIREHYRDRAQQIRDKYDHVAVLFSGGMDSWTVLHSFLDNNIHVDEIITNWPMKKLRYHDVNKDDYREANLFSEFKYAVLPVLEYVRKNFPKTKITIDDYSDILEGDFTEDRLRTSNAWQFMSSVGRIQGRSELCDTALDHNKSVVRVVGSEKTRIRVIDNKLYSYFIDLYPSGPTPNGAILECFYHSVDAPLLAILQAHYLRDAIIEKTLNGTQNVLVEKIATRGRSRYDLLYAETCYPDFPIDTFQTGKMLGTHVRDSDRWIEQHNPKFYQGWKWSYDQFFNSLDDSLTKKHNGEVVGLLAYFSGKYLVDDNFIGSDLGQYEWNRS